MKITTTNGSEYQCLMIDFFKEYVLLISSGEEQEDIKIMISDINHIESTDKLC